MEIKKREVIASVAIISIMLIIGFAIGERIHQKQLEKYQIYDTAVRIDSEDLFKHGMETNIGRAFVYGNLETLDPVTFPEIGGEYSYVKLEMQEYTAHTRVVTKTYTDSEGKTHTDTEVETYWEWDTVKTETKAATRISFLGVEFEYGTIPFPGSSFLKTIKTGSDTRNVYYGTETSFQGTIFTTLRDNAIEKTSFYKDQTIMETIERLEAGHEIVIFWIFWILLIIGAVVAFYYAENRWLD